MNKTNSSEKSVDENEICIESIRWSDGSLLVSPIETQSTRISSRPLFQLLIRDSHPMMTNYSSNPSSVSVLPCWDERCFERIKDLLLRLVNNDVTQLNTKHMNICFVILTHSLRFLSIVSDKSLSSSSHVEIFLSVWEMEMNREDERFQSSHDVSFFALTEWSDQCWQCVLRKAVFLLFVFFSFRKIREKFFQWRTSSQFDVRSASDCWHFTSRSVEWSIKSSKCNAMIWLSRWSRLREERDTRQSSVRRWSKAC